MFIETNEKNAEIFGRVVCSTLGFSRLDFNGARASYLEFMNKQKETVQIILFTRVTYLFILLQEIDDILFKILFPANH